MKTRHLLPPKISSGIRRTPRKPHEIRNAFSTVERNTSVNEQKKKETRRFLKFKVF